MEPQPRLLDNVFALSSIIEKAGGDAYEPQALSFE
jgi:hypothetical protein